MLIIRRYYLSDDREVYDQSKEPALVWKTKIEVIEARLKSEEIPKKSMEIGREASRRVRRPWIRWQDYVTRDTQATTR